MKKLLALVVVLGLSAAVARPGPVERHGALRVSGARVVGDDGKPVSLMGNSLFWSQWMGGFWNADCVNWLKQDWKAGIVRAAMGVEAGGYLEHPAEEQARVEKVVDACIAAGLYVIIDWHDHHAMAHTQAAVTFFQAMAKKYGRQPNVIYEIFNEPERVSWHNEVKPYAEEVIAAIRAIDPAHLIVVGSPHWSQDVDVAAGDPIKGANIAYALHFYAGTHKQGLRDKAESAMKQGAALFVTEWGTCKSDGNGQIDEASTAEWMAFLRQWQLCACNWAVSDKVETSSILVPGAAITGGWKDDDLTASGKLARRWMREWAEAP